MPYNDRLQVTLESINELTNLYELTKRELGKLEYPIRDLIKEIFNGSNHINKVITISHTSNFNQIVLFLDLRRFEFDYNFGSIYEEVFNYFSKKEGYEEYIDDFRFHKDEDTGLYEIKTPYVSLITIDFDKEIIDINEKKAEFLHKLTEKINNECNSALIEMNKILNNLENALRVFTNAWLVLFRKRRIKKINFDINFINENIKKTKKHLNVSDSYYNFSNSNMLMRYSNELNNLLKYKMGTNFNITVNYFKTFDEENTYFKFTTKDWTENDI